MKCKKSARGSRGEGTVVALLFLLVALLIFYPIFTYILAAQSVQNVREVGQATLDRYTIQKGREYMASVKNGHNYAPAVDQALFWQEYCEALGIGTDGAAYDTGGNLKYRLSGVGLHYAVNQVLRTEVTYTMTVPYSLLGMQIFEAEVAMTLESFFTPK